MSWVKLANSFPSHPKVLTAGPHAAWLFVCSLCYASEHLTDGRIPRSALPTLAPGVRSANALVSRLVSVGLWEVETDGWRIHDYQEWQRSSDEIRAAQKADRDRKQAKRHPNSTSDSERSPNGIPSDSLAGARGRERARASGRAVATEVETEEESPPVVPPKGGRQRDRDRWEKDIAAYAALHFPGLDPGQRFTAVRQAVTYGKATSLEDVVAFIRDQFPKLHAQLRRVEGGTA